MWQRVYFSGIFGTVPGERYWFWPVPDARNCVNVHLFIGIIYNCCNHMRPLVHLKQVNTEYNCNTTLKQKKCQYRARAYYPFHTVPSDITTIGDTMYLLKYLT